MRHHPIRSGLIQVLLFASLFTATTLPGLAMQASPALPTTQLTDTVYRADGTAATGTVLVSWPAFTTATGLSVPAGNTSVTIASGGLLTLALAPNAGSNPMGSYYTAVYHLDDGTVTREYWVVPVSSTPVTIAAIKSTVLPATVALQTVTKSYVDTAIANAVTGGTTAYVPIAGGTMTGPLVLPADPVSSLQAADKHYVDTSVAAVGGGSGGKGRPSPLRQPDRHPAHRHRALRQPPQRRRLRLAVHHRRRCQRHRQRRRQHRLRLRLRDQGRRLLQRRRTPPSPAVEQPDPCRRHPPGRPLGQLPEPRKPADPRHRERPGHRRHLHPQRCRPPSAHRYPPACIHRPRPLQ